MRVFSVLSKLANSGFFCIMEAKATTISGNEASLYESSITDHRCIPAIARKRKQSLWGKVQAKGYHPTSCRIFAYNESTCSNLCLSSIESTVSLLKIHSFDFVTVKPVSVKICSKVRKYSNPQFSITNIRKNFQTTVLDSCIECFSLLPVLQNRYTL